MRYIVIGPNRCRTLLTNTNPTPQLVYVPPPGERDGQPSGRRPTGYRVRNPQRQVPLCGPGGLGAAEEDRGHGRPRQGGHLHQLWSGGHSLYLITDIHFSAASLPLRYNTICYIFICQFGLKFILHPWAAHLRERGHTYKTYSINRQTRRHTCDTYSIDRQTRRHTCET